jgi:ADP-ribose pyrophosphatase YjhB (NUDIX family)
MALTIAPPVPLPTTFPDPDYPDYRPQSAFLADEVYTAAINGMIIVCADTLLCNLSRGTVYLATRSVYPMKGLWVLGGRVKRGEEAVRAMGRLLKAEAGFLVEPKRLRFLSMNRYLWFMRAQEPVDGGSDNLCYTFAFEPTAGELAAIQEGLTAAEYDTAAGLREFNRDQLVAARVHPVILKAYDEAMRWRRVRLTYRRLTRALYRRAA